jgi:uncharacterized membrane protein (UPF0127 family)
VRVVIAESNRLLATAEVADTAQARMTGLLGRDGLPAGQGLILEPCRLIHTFMMRFAIDVVFYDRGHRVTRAVAGVRPSRFAWGGLRARTTLELPAGTLAAGGFELAPGMQLRLERCTV